MRNTLTFLLAGGRGERLDPLTRDRTKPAVPFGGIFRIVDFTLSNCINSGLRRIYILTQYKSFSLQKHIIEGWDVVSTQLGEFIDIIPAQQRVNDEWYRGTADAIYQNIYAIKDWDPEHILILSGDHVYKMDYQNMMQAHRDNKADLTVACVSMPKETSDQFGVMVTDEDNRVLGFQEKPADPKTIPGRSDLINASMGIYLFGTISLLEALEVDSRSKGSQRDFGKDVIPAMIKAGKRVYVHDFKGLDGEPNYWRDIGTRDAYYQANMDLLVEKPKFDLYDKNWRIRTHQHQYPPLKIVNTASHEGRAVNSIISDGCLIQGATVDHSVLSPSIYLHNGASVKNSVIMENVTIGEGAQIQNAIVDKQVHVPPYAKIGFDLEEDKKQFVLTRSGIVIVPKRMEIDSK